MFYREKIQAWPKSRLFHQKVNKLPNQKDFLPARSKFYFSQKNSLTYCLANTKSSEAQNFTVNKGKNFSFVELSGTKA